MGMENWWSGDRQGGTEVLGDNPVLVPLCPPQISLVVNPCLGCATTATTHARDKAGSPRYVVLFLLLQSDLFLHLHVIGVGVN
jgi:hypothetical protein